MRALRYRPMGANNPFVAVRRFAAGLQLAIACLGFVVLPGVHLFNHKNDHHHDDANNGFPSDGDRDPDDHDDHDHDHDHHDHDHDQDADEHGALTDGPRNEEARQWRDHDDHHHSGSNHGGGSLAHLQKSFRTTATRVLVFAVWRAEFSHKTSKPFCPLKRHPWEPQQARGPPTAGVC